jgi:hypothetical protein
MCRNKLREGQLSCQESRVPLKMSLEIIYQARNHVGNLAGAPVSIFATFYSDFLACMDTCSVVDPECSGSDFSDSSGSGPWILFRILHEFILNLGTFL